MTLPRVPFTMETGKTISPAKINTNMASIASDVGDVLAHRYTYSDFVLEYDGLSSSSVASVVVHYIKAPFAYTIVGAELVAYDADTSQTITVTTSGVSAGWENISVTCAGATTRSRTYKDLSARVEAATEIAFTVSFTTTTAVDRCYLRVYIRSDRANAAVTYSTYGLSSAIAVASGDSGSASELNTAFTDIETAVSANAAADRDLRIMVFGRRELAATVDYLRDVRIPGSGIRIHTFDFISTAGNTKTVVATIFDEASATVASATINGTGVGTTTTKSQGNSVADTQTPTAYTTTSNDYTIRVDRTDGTGGTAISIAYIVLYYS